MSFKIFDARFHDEFVQTRLGQLQYPRIITIGQVHYSALARLIGSLAVAVGLLTRIAAWVQNRTTSERLP